MKSKRLTLVFLALLFFMSLFAESSKNVPAVTMVSYEQSWLDTEGTLALRNNLDEDIHNVVFQIIYLDMSDNPLDYEEFSKKVDIAPGMTKKIDIPAYEYARHYHYYKTKDEFHNPAFKIKFKLKSYNEREVVTENSLRKTFLKHTPSPNGNWLRSWRTKPSTTASLGTGSYHWPRSARWKR